MTPTLMTWLLDRYPRAKRTTLRDMLAHRRITINGLFPANLGVPVADGDVVRVAPRPEPRASTARPTDPRVRIVHEDDDLIVVDKPAGLLTSTTARERRATLLKLLQHDLDVRRPAARVGVIHRLDREASGLLVFSLNDRTYRALKSQFFRHDVDRVYFAVVEGVPAQRQRTIRSRLVELPNGRVKTTDRPGAGQVAITEFIVVREGPGRGRSLLRVTLQTGRKHQIRAHLSEAGHPIVGDAVYGGRMRDSGLLLLQASELAFEHPRDGRKMKFTLTLPGEFGRAIGETVDNPDHMASKGRQRPRAR